MKCFKKAGITSTNYSVVGHQYEDEDAFADLEAQEELQSLVDQIPVTEACCGVDEYINGEGDVPVCMEYDNDWEEHFFADLNANSSPLPEDPNEEDDFDLEPPPQKITKYQDAIAALKDVQVFMNS